MVLISGGSPGNVTAPPLDPSVSHRDTSVSRWNLTERIPASGTWPGAQWARRAWKACLRASRRNKEGKYNLTQMHLEFTEFCAGMFGGGVKLKEESSGLSSAASLKGCRTTLHNQLHTRS